MGYEHQNDSDQQFTKPKHRIIADAYAKRMDEMISISMDDSRIDPASLNFDMNHLDSITSEAMGATLTNYLSNIIHRRNAMTTQTRIDFNDPNCVTAAAATTASASAMLSQHQHSSTVDNNNSEISVSVRHFSVESRRNSLDSQVSQMSVKMSEIKTRIESRKQKRRNKNPIAKAKKRTRNHDVYARSSQNNGKEFEYGDSTGDNFSKVNSTNLMALVQPSSALLPIERFSAHTTADINDLNELLHHQSYGDANPMTSDDEEVRQPMEQIYSDYRLSTNSTGDSVDGMDDIKSASVDQMVRTFLQTNTGNQIETFNPSMNGCRKFDANDVPNSKRPKYTKMANGNGNGMAFPLPPSQSINCKSMMTVDDCCATETHQLLLPHCKRDPTSPSLIIRKENLSGKHLSESEKMEQLKRLLLPSN